jgi:hypothetical protein
MDAEFRIVTRLPLEHLWRGSESAVGTRRRALSADDIVRLLRQGTVEFVVADVGQKPRWIAPTHCYEFWKAEVESHLATGESRIVLDNFPDAYCYFASEWGTAESASPIVVLERHH